MIHKVGTLRVLQAVQCEAGTASARCSAKPMFGCSIPAVHPQSLKAEQHRAGAAAHAAAPSSGSGAVSHPYTVSSRPCRLCSAGRGRRRTLQRRGQLLVRYPTPTPLSFRPCRLCSAGRGRRRTLQRRVQVLVQQLRRGAGLRHGRDAEAGRRVGRALQVRAHARARRQELLQVCAGRAHQGTALADVAQLASMPLSLGSRAR